MNFYKMHGIGNDFILFNNMDGKVYVKFKDINSLAKQLCQRRLGVGADGVILLDTSFVADFKMRIFNPDGSEAQMCGNGIRCAAVLYQELFEKRNRIFTVETLAGIKKVEIEKEDEKFLASVSMGKPNFSPQAIPIKSENEAYLIPLEVAEENLTISSVSMGNPHCVVFAEDNEDMDLENRWLYFGKLLEEHPFFPEKTNVEFVWREENNTYRVKVWERGAGRTLGCGTGGSAVMAILHRRYGTEEATIKMEGGNLYLKITPTEGVILKGEIEKVFQGKLWV